MHPIPYTSIKHTYSERDLISLTARTSYVVLDLKELLTGIAETIADYNERIESHIQETDRINKWLSCANHTFDRMCAGTRIVDTCTSCGLEVAVRKSSDTYHD